MARELSEEEIKKLMERKRPSVISIILGGLVGYSLFILMVLAVISGIVALSKYLIGVLF